MAQCYERPLWRSCGDVDFFLDDENYEKAKGFLKPLAASVEEEYVREKHLGMPAEAMPLYDGCGEMEPEGGTDQGFRVLDGEFGA